MLLFDVLLPIYVKKTRNYYYLNSGNKEIMKMKGVSKDNNQQIIKNNFLKAICESTPNTGCNKTLRIKKLKRNMLCLSRNRPKLR
jgi:hypothetical protein